MEDKFGQVHVVLEMLRRVNVENGISMAFDKEADELWFFDTEHYLRTKKASGIKIKLTELVE